jgi:hypothetical protein
MFDAVIFSGPDPEAAARTLAGLVEGVVESLLNRVLVISAAEDTRLEKLADASGCRLEQNVAPPRLAATMALHLATGHVFAFEAGALLPPGWPSLLNQEFQRRGLPGLEETLAFRPAALGARLKLTAAITARRPLPLTYGALLPRSAITDKGYPGGPVSLRKAARMTAMTVTRI